MKAKWITLTLAAILADAVTAISLTACGSEDTSSVAESAIVSETAAEIAETTEPAAEETASVADSETESATESAEAPAESAAQPATQPATPVQVSAGATAQQPQTTAPATPAPQNHAPLYRQQWVVDKAAWTEEQPVYETKILSICNNCGADITGFAPKHCADSLGSGGQCGSYRTEPRQVQTGTKTIYHEEQGHYEQVLVCAGCTSTH